MWIVHQWQNLKQLKHGSCGHEDGSIQGTKASKLTLFCLACLQPGINLLPGWELTPEAQRCKICYSTALLCWHDFQIFIRSLPGAQCKFSYETEGVQQWARSKLKWRMGLFCWGGTLQGTPDKALGSEAGCMLALSPIHLASLTYSPVQRLCQPWCHQQTRSRIMRTCCHWSIHCWLCPS